MKTKQSRGLWTFSCQAQFIFRSPAWSPDVWGGCKRDTSHVLIAWNPKRLNSFRKKGVTNGNNHTRRDHVTPNMSVFSSEPIYINIMKKRSNTDMHLGISKKSYLCPLNKGNGLSDSLPHKETHNKLEKEPFCVTLPKIQSSCHGFPWKVFCLNFFQVHGTL